MSLEAWLMLIAIICEGPIVWWFARRDRREDNMNARMEKVENSIRNVHNRIDELDEKYATKDEVESKIEHVKEVVNLQFSAIMENLKYIRDRLDGKSNRDD